MFDIIIEQEYLDCQRCPTHHKDIIHYCQSKQCNNHRLCCKECLPHHKGHPTQNCKDKLLTICHTLTKANHPNTEYIFQSALNLSQISKIIENLQTKLKELAQMAENIKYLRMKVMMDSLVYPAEGIYGHFDVSGYGEGQWRELQGIAKEWGAIELERMGYKEFTYEKVKVVEKIQMQVVENVERIERMLADLQDQISLSSEDLAKWNKSKSDKQQVQVQKLAYSIFQSISIKSKDNKSNDKQKEKELIQPEIMIPSTKILDLSNKSLSNTKALQKIAQNTSLLLTAQTINLSNNAITDEGLQQIFLIAKNKLPNLQNLLLSYNLLTAQCVQIIESVEMPKLTYIDLRRNNNIRFQEALVFYGGRFANLMQVQVDQ